METIRKISALRTLLILLCTLFAVHSFSQKQSAVGKVDNYSDSVAVKYLKSAPPDPVEGIWLTDNGYKIAIEKNPENGARNSKLYRAIILKADNHSDFWKPGYIRAFIEVTATPGVFYIDYFTANHDTVLTETCTGYYDKGDYAFRIKPVNNNIDAVSLYKVYPKDDGDQTDEKDIYPPAYGSGLVFTEDGYIVTNNHVVCNAKTITITGINKDFKKKYTAKVVVTDEINDLALLKISSPAFKEITDVPFTFRFDNIMQGEEAFALGYPSAQEMPESATLTDGKVSSVSGINGNSSFYRTSVRLRPGNSGGPLFDTYGNIIGINSLRITSTENVSYAVNVKCLRDLSNIAEDKPVFAFLNTIAEMPLIEKSGIISNYVCIVDCNNYFKLTTFDAGNVKVLGSENPSGKYDDPDTYYTMAMLKVNSKDYPAALTLLNKAIKGGINKPLLYFLRGQIRTSLKKELGDALDDFNYCLKHDTDSTAFPTYIYYRALTYDLLEKYREAEKDYTSCINMNAGNVVVSLKARAVINEKLGGYDAAIADWDTLISYYSKTETPAKADIYYHKAYCLLKKNKAEDALALINKSLDIMATDVKMWVLRAEIYYKLALYENSVKDINKALSVDEEPGAYYVRGLAYKELGNKDLSQKDLNKAALLGFKDN